MIPYIVILVIFLLGLRVSQDKQKKFYILCCLCMFLLVALRAWFVGVDTQTYIKFFQLNEVESHATEPLWNLYLGWMVSITNNYQVYLAVSAFLTLIPLFFLIWKKSEMALLSLFVFFLLPNDQGYIFVMSGIRQALAITMVLWMFYAFENRKWIWVVVLSVAAFLMHNSSVMALLGLLVVSVIKPNQITMTILLLVALVLMLFSYSMGNVFAVIGGTSLINLAFIEDYSSYATYLVNEYSQTFISKLFLIAPLLIMIGLLLLNKEILSTLYGRLYMFGSLLLIVFSGVPMISRYFMYFILLEMYLVPQIYNSKEFKYNKAGCVVLLVFHFLILFIYLYVNYSHGINFSLRRVAPYHFFFERGIPMYY